MRGLYILGEGPTEEHFIRGILSDYFRRKSIYDVRCILMETSPGFKGGDITYLRYKHNAEKLLKQQDDIIVTSLIDFFRLSKDFPGYEESLRSYPHNKIRRVEYIEESISVEIKHPRFIPYIQLHEFEGLLFSSDDGFKLLPDLPRSILSQLEAAVNEHSNPELLNDGATTAPSKRLISLIPQYQKTLHGPYIAEAVTIEKMIARCDRFRNWIETLTNRMLADEDAR